MEHDPKSKLPDDEAGQAISESKMRQALGIEARSPDRHANPSHGGAAAQRRRFVNDGEVPVVMIGRRREHASGDRAENVATLADRAAQAEQQLANEREARSRAETQLAEARQTIQTLQASVAHTGLTRDEAVAQAQRAAAEHALALRELQELQEKRRAAPPEPKPAPMPALAKPSPPPLAAPTSARAVIERPRRAAVPAEAIVGGDVPAFAAQILSAYLACNRVHPAELPGLAESVMYTLAALSSANP